MSDVIADWPRNRILSLLTLGRRHGLDDAVLLAGTGLTASALSGSEHGASRSDEYQVVRNLLAEVDGSLPLPLEAGLDYHLVAIGSWGEGMRTSPNLGSALAFGLGFAAHVPTTVAVSAEIEGPDLRLTFDDAHLPDDVRHFITVRNMVFIDMTARELVGRKVATRRISVRMPRPPYAAALEEFCASPVTWNAEATVVVVDAAVLSEPLSAADPEAHAEAVRECHRMITQHRRKVPVADRVRMLLGQPDDVATGLVEVADQLGMSERNLRRLLALEGTSFREVLDGVRFDRAKGLLADETTLEEISRRLGYSEPASFIRAFKRWSGTTPAAFRAAVQPTSD